ncbi:hypothetical protein GCM10009606_31080 [Nocardioides aquiterrae]|uniref:Uncharacterized protein n=1 Tax=Nocardioides aquiterrae TaxID=203799 RepID=A0ABN1UG65_9ACTN
MNSWATGPGPLRTARGAGRRAAGLRVGLRVDFFGAGLRRGLVLRVAVLELFDVDRVEDVLLLRDPGGEDVRVAIVDTLRRGHSRHTHHRSACRRRASGSDDGGGPLVEPVETPGPGRGRITDTGSALVSPGLDTRVATSQAQSRRSLDHHQRVR